MYNIKFEKRVSRDIKKIDKKEIPVILDQINQLAKNPYPSNSSKLKGRDAWRVRIGNYRIIYSVLEQEAFSLIAVKYPFNCFSNNCFFRLSALGSSVV